MLAAPIRTLQPKVWHSQREAAAVAVLRQLLPLRALRRLVPLALRQLLLPLIQMLLLPLLRPVVVVVAAAVAVAALLLLRALLLQLLPHPALRLPVLRRRLLRADAVDNNAILTTILRLDAVLRAWAACLLCITLPVKATLLRFAPCSMAARISTRPRSTARLRWQSPFSTPSGTLRWN